MTEQGSHQPITATLERRPHPQGDDARKEIGTVRLYVGRYPFLEVGTEWFTSGDPDELIIAGALEHWFAEAAQR